MRDCVVQDLGRMRYREALDIQLQIASERKQGLGVDHLLFVEHPHVEPDLGGEPRDRLPDVPAADEQYRHPRQGRQVRDSLPHAGPRAGLGPDGAL